VLQWKSECLSQTYSRKLTKKTFNKRPNVYLHNSLKASPAFITDTTIVLVVFSLFLFSMFFSLPFIVWHFVTGSQFHEHSASLVAF